MLSFRRKSWSIHLHLSFASFLPVSYVFYDSDIKDSAFYARFQRGPVRRDWQQRNCIKCRGAVKIFYTATTCFIPCTISTLLDHTSRLYQSETQARCHADRRVKDRSGRGVNAGKMNHKASYELVTRPRVRGRRRRIVPAPIIIPR